MDVKISPKVAEALANKEPVVALESTIISHGLPWPQNHQFALELENELLEQSVTPATIAVIEGQAHCGLDHDMIQYIAQTGTALHKFSSFDLPWGLGKGLSGSTTVAGTIAIAEKAGVRVFATGGIGGVHRGFGEIPDVSHDLVALSKHSMIVVSAGAKAILDLAATKEYLETLGVLSIGFQTSTLPAFYYRDSGIDLTYRVESEQEICEVFKHIEQGSLLVFNPIPTDSEIPASQIEPMIEQALLEAKQQHITGKHVTPFLLQQMSVLSGSRSVECNLNLVRNNVRLAAKIATLIKILGD